MSYILVHVCIGICTHMCPCTWMPESIKCPILSLSALLPWDKNYCWTWSCAGEQKALEILLLPSLVLGLYHIQLWGFELRSSCLHKSSYPLSNLIGFYFIYFVLCVWMFWLHLCNGTSVCRAHGDQKRASDPLALKWQAVVSCHAGAGIQTQALCKSI